ncbi:MFS transporter [Hespellia stercorisuis]|uniref:Predicted arabinose efflux permease, MFS family n=1 Tax=Hespellia stercorisuis DSM 15480 TaxID=1121950 RepID=A0A1M6TV01_9FIRM|nr:MFS transporter [Hespellia stercorisuis]SHK60781.1 Predicted arabinose efflux permease, MFS family [Hespellia stercorisuis DSM 15480]
MNNKSKFYPSAFVLYLNYFIHGIGCSVLGQAVIKESLVTQWGLSDVGLVTMVAAALGLGRLIALPFAGPLSDKLGRRIASIIGAGSYAIFFLGLAFSPNMAVAYVAAVLGGIANSFLDCGVIPCCVEILEPRSSMATMLTKFSISCSQLLLPFMIGAITGANLSLNILLYVAGAAILVIAVAVFFIPLPEAEKKAAGEKTSLVQDIKNANFSIESIALILIGFTGTATFQLWLNCAQDFAKEVVGIADPSKMQTYYSFGSLAAIIVTTILVNKIKGVRFIFVYPLIATVMIAAVYLLRTPAICYIGAAVVGYSAGAVVLQLVTATANDLFPRIKGTITSIVMIASSLSNYTILSVAGKMQPANILVMNIVITIIGVLLALFVNVRYNKLLEKAEESK